MPGFKSMKQKGFLFASNKDKAEGQDPQQVYAQKSSAASIPTSHPPQMSGAPKAFALGVLGSSTKFHPPVPGQIKPTSNPSMSLPKSGVKNPVAVPALPGLPKFAKTRKFLK